MTAPEVDPIAHVRRMAAEGRRLLDARDARADPSEPESDSEVASRAILGLLEPLIAEVDRLRADCERRREMVRDLSAHHVQHHEWDKVADSLLAAADVLANAVTDDENGDGNTIGPSVATFNALAAYRRARAAAMVDT